MSLQNIAEFSPPLPVSGNPSMKTTRSEYRSLGIEKLRKLTRSHVVQGASVQKFVALVEKSGPKRSIKAQAYGEDVVVIPSSSGQGDSAYICVLASYIRGITHAVIKVRP